MVEVVRMPYRCAVSMDLTPLRGGEFVARQRVADGVVENFGGGAGQAVLRPFACSIEEIVADRHAGEFDAVDDFHRGEGVGVHFGAAVFPARRTSR